MRPGGVPRRGDLRPGAARLQRVGLGQVEGEVVQDPRAQLTDAVVGEERQRAHDQHRRRDRKPLQQRTQVHPAPRERDHGRDGGERHRHGGGRAVARESHRDEGHQHHRRQADGWRGPGPRPLPATQSGPDGDSHYADRQRTQIGGHPRIVPAAVGARELRKPPRRTRPADLPPALRASSGGRRPYWRTAGRESDHAYRWTSVAPKPLTLTQPVYSFGRFLFGVAFIVRPKPMERNWIGKRATPRCTGVSGARARSRPRPRPQPVDVAPTCLRQGDEVAAVVGAGGGERAHLQLAVDQKSGLSAATSTRTCVRGVEVVMRPAAKRRDRSSW